MLKYLTSVNNSQAGSICPPTQMEDSKFSAGSAVSLKIGGVSVKFPVKPYKSQLSMMSMIIKGLEKKQHCLLESPTGSGKSLALLCSAIAWQQAQHEKYDKELLDKLTTKAEKENQTCTCDKMHSMKSMLEGLQQSISKSKYFNGHDQANCSTSVIDLCTPEDDDFKESSKQASNTKVKTENNTCPACSCAKSGDKSKEKNVEEKEKKVRVPKIWFGTRTHKQIAQITKELGRTSYDTTNMTILSSRQHSCIHPAVMKSSNKNEECKDLRRGKHASGGNCAFYQNVHRMKNHHQLSCTGMKASWDLEDLIGLGKNIKACPYYSAKELVASAHIIFCPYNYLIDPMIRTQMQINLSNQIVILDEAHNIEDSAREAGSCTMTEDSLANTTADLEYLINDGIKVEDHRPLHLLCMRLGQWVNQHSRNLTTADYETSSQVWYGRDIITHLTEWGITQDTLPLLEGNFQEATDLGEEDIETAKILHSSSQSTLGGLFNVLRYMMTKEYKYRDDYRITIVRNTSYGPVPPKRTRDGWVTLHKHSKKHFVTNLHFWCLNPAVAFNDLSTAHSIILTSGTLSPMSSFSSELGLSFPIQLEANHVIQDSQVWVGSIGRGPSGIQLEATYKNTDKFEFQDELGNLIGAVCDHVPHGVLCFFSSYNMLKKLKERWQATGLWNKVEERKSIICEPRSSSKDEFDSILQSFYDAVKESEEGDVRSGALLLAVCRGKVSEGLDFADNNARAVITVGIPFPNIKDKQVELKRKYNDIHKNQRGLLSGAQWYEIQAYRAMNQALGRCIRHKTDWGALIIVDERFCKNPKKYSAGLSKWVRQKMRPYPSYQSAISNIAAFVQRQMSANESFNTNGITETQPCNLPTILPTPSLHDLTKPFESISQILNIERSPPRKTFTKTDFPGKIDLSTKKKNKTIKPKRPAPTQTSFCKEELSPDEDFQIDNLKTPKYSTKKKSVKTDLNHSRTFSEIADTSVIKTESNVASTSNDSSIKKEANSIMHDDLFTLFNCTIPATPEKLNVTIVPESPSSVNGEIENFLKESDVICQAIDFNDETSNSRKRKPVQEDTDALTPHSKRTVKKEACWKKSLEQNSGEFPSRTMRRQRSTRTKKSKSDAESMLRCANCPNLFYTYTQKQPLNFDQIQSVYISDHFQKNISAKYKQNSICSVYLVDEDSLMCDSIRLKTESSDGKYNIMLLTSMRYTRSPKPELNNRVCRCFYFTKKPFQTKTALNEMFLQISRKPPNYNNNGYSASNLFVFRSGIEFYLVSARTQMLSNVRVL